jgi:hypothetical protein
METKNEMLQKTRKKAVAADKKGQPHGGGPFLES